MREISRATVCRSANWGGPLAADPVERNVRRLEREHDGIEMKLLGEEKIIKIYDEVHNRRKMTNIVFYEEFALAIEAAVLEQFAQGVKVQIPSHTFEQEMQNQRRIGYEQGKKAAVLEAQSKQEPVAWRYKIIPPGWTYSEKKPSRDFAGDAWDRWEVTPLYAAPVVQPDMVLVPREPTIEMREALQVGTGATFLETKAIYRRLLAAAEGRNEQRETD